MNFNTSFFENFYYVWERFSVVCEETLSCVISVLRVDFLHVFFL